MPISEFTIYRRYRCYNPECQAEIVYKETVADPWKSKCPFCKKKELVLVEGNMNLSILVGTSQAKTFGMLMEHNRDEKLKRGEIEPEKKKPLPFWRKKDKVDFGILKNPVKYIQTGEK